MLCVWNAYEIHWEKCHFWYTILDRCIQFRSREQISVVLLFKLISTLTALMFWPLTSPSQWHVELSMNPPAPTALFAIRGILRVPACGVMNCPKHWSRSEGQLGAGSCTLALFVDLPTCSTPPSVPLPRPPLLGPYHSINGSEAAELLLRSPSASLHSAYTRLPGLISKLHPSPRLQPVSHLWSSAVPQLSRVIYIF